MPRVSGLWRERLRLRVREKWRARLRLRLRLRMRMKRPRKKKRKKKKQEVGQKRRQAWQHVCVCRWTTGGGRNDNVCDDGGGRGEF